jgi:hypothetical protein
MAKGRQRVVELGTGSAWTAISLVLTDSGRQVISYDPVERDRESYLHLVSPQARRRLTLMSALGDEGPGDDTRVDLLFIDSSHERDHTVCEVEVWRPFLSENAVVVIDDYGHPQYPGVREAVRCLGLRGQEYDDALFVYCVGADAARS